MKLFQIMFFLLIFNVAISITGSLHIYNMGMSGQVPTGENSPPLTGQDSDGDGISDIDEGLTNPNVADDGLVGLWLFVGGSAGMLIFGTISGAVIGRLAGIPTSESIAYSFFGTLITLIFTSTTQVLWSMTTWLPSEAQLGAQVIIGLFLGVSGLLCVFGYLQLIRGGFGGYL